MEVNINNRFILDIKLSKNQFLNNIGTFDFTTGAVYISCYLPVFSTDNFEFGKYRYDYSGFEDEITTNNNILLNREEYLKTLHGKVFS